MNNYLGDIISIFICLWVIKTYLLHYRMTKEEAFIVREAPKVFLYPLTILVCIMLILVPLSERGLVPGVVPDSILKYTLVSFMLWITLVLYTKWNWGVHVTDRKVRSRNNMQMLLLLILLFLLATIL